MIGVGIVIVVGLAVFVIVLVVAIGLAKPVPEDPDPEAVAEVAVDYRCSVCGMRLTVTLAQGDEELTAPRHCREEMIEV